MMMMMMMMVMMMTMMMVMMMMMMLMIVGEDYVRPVPDLAAGPLSWGHFSLSHAN